MRKICTTAGLHPRDRFDYWMSVIRRDFIDNDAVPARRRAFRADLRAGSIGGVKLALARSSELRVAHTKRHSGQPSDDQLFVFMPLAKTKTVRQNGRQAVLDPGQFALVDPRLPHEGCFSEDSEVLTVMMERRALESRLGAVHDLTARPLTSDTAEGRLAAGYLAMLPAQAGQLSSAGEDMIETHLLDLLALALGKAVGGRISLGSSARSLIRMRLHAAVEEMLADPGLNTEAVAAAVGVSTRHANAILADQATSLGRLIQARRLARCREALEDPNQMHRTVSEIAYGWGFSDMTHFGRRFRFAYGMLPSACRRQTRAQA